MNASSITNGWFLRDELDWDYEHCYLGRCEGDSCEGICTLPEWRQSNLFRSLDVRFRELLKKRRIIQLCENRRPPFRGKEIQIIDPRSSNCVISIDPQDLYHDQRRAFDKNWETKSNICQWCIERVVRGLEHPAIKTDHNYHIGAGDTVEKS